LTIDGGDTFESAGDRLVVHNQDGTVHTASLTTTTVPQLASETFQVYTYNSHDIYVATNDDFVKDTTKPAFIDPQLSGTPITISFNDIYAKSSLPSTATPKTMAGQVYGSIEESFLSVMTSPVISLLNNPKASGALKVEAVTSAGARTTLAS